RLVAVEIEVPGRGTCGPEAVEHRGLSLVVRADEAIPLMPRLGEELVEEGAHPLLLLTADDEQQVVFEPIAELEHPLRQLLPEQTEGPLGDRIGNGLPEERQLREHTVGPVLQREELDLLTAAGMLDRHERVLAVLLGEVERG